jgi:GNAT superfamily N-acetyltransferase
MVRIKEVKDKKSLKEFLHLPFKIYEGDRNWVPPLLSEVTATLSPKNPFFEHARAQLFLAQKDSETVGRIAGIVDENYIKFYDERTGYFGFYEAIEDPEVSNALYSAAAEYLRSQGMAEMMGPMNPWTTDECGFLLEGFDEPPKIMMDYNPKYYLAQCEEFGFKKAKDLYAYYRRTETAPPPKLLDLLERLRRKPHIKVRPANFKDLAAEVARIKAIYNSAWANNWGFVPLTDKEFDLMLKRLRPLVTPDLVPIVEVQGEPAGVAITLPDYNQALIRLNGRLGPIGLAKFLYYRRKITDVRLMALGVKPEYQRLGVDALLYWSVFQAAHKRGYQGGEVSWILEDNQAIIRSIELWGCRLYKRYRIYKMKL